MSQQLYGIKLKRFLKNRYAHDLDIVIVLENIQYARNVAEVFRIADAVKASKIILTGISQKPPFGKDLAKVSRSKEKSIPWEFAETTGPALNKLEKNGYTIVALELTEDAAESTDFVTDFKSNKIAIVVGNEGYGVVKNTLTRTQHKVMLPMYGKGASLNVSVSLAVFIYLVILTR